MLGGSQEGRNISVGDSGAARRAGETRGLKQVYSVERPEEVEGGGQQGHEEGQVGVGRLRKLPLGLLFPP